MYIYTNMYTQTEKSIRRKQTHIHTDTDRYTHTYT